MMLFNCGILLSATTHAYLMPEENGEHLVYADTRILDPRYARSAEPLVCAHHEERFNPIISVSFLFRLSCFKFSNINFFHDDSNVFEEKTGVV